MCPKFLIFQGFACGLLRVIFRFCACPVRVRAHFKGDSRMSPAAGRGSPPYGREPRGLCVAEAVRLAFGRAHGPSPLAKDRAAPSRREGCRGPPKARRTVPRSRDRLPCRRRNPRATLKTYTSSSKTGARPIRDPTQNPNKIKNLGRIPNLVVSFQW